MKLNRFFSSSGFKLFLKIAIAAGAIFYLYYTDKLNSEKMRVFFYDPLPVLIISAILILLLLPVTAYRLFLLTSESFTVVRFWKMFLVTWIGNFFNVTMPGMVSGDIVKGYYVKRIIPGLAIKDLISLILMDRIVGLSGLIIINCAGLFFVREIATVPSALIIIVVALTTGVVVFFSLVTLSFGGRVEKLVEFLLKIPFFSIFGRVIVRLRSVGAYPSRILLCLFLSCAVHVFTVGFFFVISVTYFTDSPDLGRQMIIVPLGLILVALPISPSGIGVGHVAFESLYRFIGSPDGADIFNLYIIIHLATNLLGFIPYIFFRKDQKDMKLAEAEKNRES